MLDLISVGEMVIDFLPGEEAGVYIRKAGGAPANAAIAVARNRLFAGFCGRVGADDFGRFLLDTLKENQVAVLCPDMVEEAVTTMAFVTLGPGGERSFTFARKPGADMFLTKADVDVALAQGARILHAGSCSLSAPPASEATAYALSQASKRGYMVSFDVNYRDLMWGGDRAAARASVAAILPYVDLLKISEEETDFMGGQEGIQAMAAETGIAAVVETLGAQGARCYWQDAVWELPGRPAKAVDATGAGDAFWGGFLSCLLHSGVHGTQQLTRSLLQEAMEYGNAAGWLCVQKKGAIESLPTLAEIERIRKEGVL